MYRRSFYLFHRLLDLYIYYSGLVLLDFYLTPVIQHVVLSQTFYHFLLLYLWRTSWIFIFKTQPLPPILIPNHAISGQRFVKSLMITLMLLSRDKTPDSLFHPTSFLNPGYGVLFTAYRTITPECVQTLLSGCFKNTTYSQYAPGTRRMVTKDVKKVYLFSRNIMKIRHSKPFLMKITVLRIESRLFILNLRSYFIPLFLHCVAKSSSTICRLPLLQQNSRRTPNQLLWQYCLKKSTTIYIGASGQNTSC